MDALFHVHHVQTMASFALPQPVPKNSKALRGCSPWKQFLLSLLAGSLCFGIMIINFYSRHGPIIPGKEILGSGMLIPHTSFTVPVSGLYCESFVLSRLSWDNSEAAVSWNATVYVVSEKPPSDHYNFTISNNITLDAGNRWYMRYAHLRSGSKVAINSCAQEGDQKLVRACILQGKGSFEEWLSNLYNCKGSHMFEYALDTCAGNEQLPPSTRDHHFPVKEENTYYFVHYAVTNSSIHHLSMNISISSFDYDILEANISCTTGDSNFCKTTNIPLGFRGLAIITPVVERSIKDFDSWSYEDTIQVAWNCDASLRGYILVFCIPFGGACACVILCFLLIGCSIRYNCCNHIRARNTCCVRSDTTPVLSQPQPHRESQAPASINQLDHVTLKKRRRCGKKTFICISCLIFILMLTPILTSIEGIAPIMAAYNAEHILVLTPGETRSFAVNKFFCSSISIGIIGSSRLSASIWIVDMDPQLTESSNVMNRENFVCDVPNMFCYEAWRSYMHPGSTLHVKAANYGKSAAFFTRFSDETSFNDFLSNPKNRSSVSIEADIEIDFLFNATGDQIFVLFSANEAAVNVSLYFNRTEFSTSKLSNLSSCELHSYTETIRKLPIPFGQGNVNGLVEVKSDWEDSSNYSYWEYLTVITYCNYRADSWTLVWLPILMVNIALIVFLHWVCCKPNRQIPRDATPGDAPLVATADAAPVATQDDLNKQSRVSNMQLVSGESNGAHTAVPTQVPVATSSREAGTSTSAVAAVTVMSSEISATSGAEATTSSTTGNSEVGPSPYERLSSTIIPVAVSNTAEANSMHTALAEEEDLVFATTSETDPLLP